MTPDALIDILRAAVPETRLETGPAFDQPTIHVDREHLVEVCETLRDKPELNFSLLADVTAVDWLSRRPRFEVVYHLACLGDWGVRPNTDRPIAPARLRLKVPLSEDDARLSTVSSVWPSAAWPEREVWDLFGIVFDGHPDLRRILLPDEWEGHPLRKDYPVQVNVAARTYEPLQVSEEEFVANIEASRRVPGTPPGGIADHGSLSARAARRAGRES